MKTINNILAIASIALSLTACSSDNESTSNNEGKEYPISLSVGIGDLSVVTRAESTTIGSPTSTPLTSGDLGLFITKNGEKSGTGKYLCDNTGFEYDDTAGWICGHKYYWASDDAKINYIAYYPYQYEDAIIDTYNKTIKWDVSTQSATEPYRQFPNLDLLYEKKDNVENKLTGDDAHSIAITLAHVCSKLTVNVSRLGSEITSGTKISGIKINNIDVEGTFFLDTGAWSSNDNNQTSSISMVDVTPSTINDGDPIKTYEAILIPQTALTTLMITLSNNATYQLSIPNQEYKMGTHYTITIQVGQDQVGLGEINQTPWKEETGGNLTAQ